MSPTEGTDTSASTLGSPPSTWGTETPGEGTSPGIWSGIDPSSFGASSFGAAAVPSRAAPPSGRPTGGRPSVLVPDRGSGVVRLTTGTLEDTSTGVTSAEGTWGAVRDPEAPGTAASTAGSVADGPSAFFFFELKGFLKKLDFFGLSRPPETSAPACIE